MEFMCESHLYIAVLHFPSGRWTVFYVDNIAIDQICYCWFHFCLCLKGMNNIAIWEGYTFFIAIFGFFG